MSTTHEQAREEPREEPMPEIALADETAATEAVADVDVEAVVDVAAASEVEAVAEFTVVAAPAPAVDGPDASLLALVDRLTAVLERGELGELEVAWGGTTVVLRSQSAIERAAPPAAPAAAVDVVAAGQPAAGTPVAAGAPGTPVAAAPAPAVRPSVKAPLTGLYYTAPSPGATPYLRVGDHVSVGQIIGLIEAMKLFNEIKSDLAGRVVRICADNGALVKAKQALIEVEL